PREYFHYNYASKHDFSSTTYEEEAKPWAIGYGSALSDYLGQAYMTQLAAPKATDVVLEVGTGSGYQISLLSRLVKQAYSIEIIQPLGTGVSKIFKPLGYENVSTRVGDGYFGWPDVKEGFDIIMVTCAAQFVPPALIAQLKPGGRLVIPIGQPFKRGQVLYLYTKDDKGKVRSRKDVGVYFIPMTGQMQKEGGA
ncbi:MAG: protein-L-isoaspartate O-methyltransferase, partial [Deltaproteobacteria bacterium]|nr:protein-L-isoaspartate O-methyltransferase [Deltaproteobacteria bacterium]